jgi:hypothetical protein
VLFKFAEGLGPCAYLAETISLTRSSCNGSISDLAPPSLFPYVLIACTRFIRAMLRARMAAAAGHQGGQ